MACADEADPTHQRARQARDAALEEGKILVTTDYVVDESLTLISVRLSLIAAEAWWAQLEGSSGYDGSASAWPALTRPAISFFVTAIRAIPLRTARVSS
jgi:hypothetical protein